MDDGNGAFNILALKNGFGSVFRCANGCVHLSVGRVAIAFSEQEYVELVDLVSSSAANFELLRGASWCDGPDEELSG